MTCVVAVTDGEKITIGADSAGVNEFFDLTVRADEKVWTKDGWAFGICGSFRLGNLLRYKLKTPPILRDLDVFEYMCTSFVDEMRQIFFDNGFMKVKHAVEQFGNSSIIVGFEGDLFEIQSDFQVAKASVPYLAIGCGDPYAKGAMSILIDDTSVSDRDKVKRALLAAEQHSAGVRGPFKIITT